MEHGVWQMFLGEVQHQQNIVNSVFDTGQVADTHRSVGHHRRTVVGHQKRNTNSIAEVLVAADGWDVRRLQTNSLQTKHGLLVVRGAK